MSGSSVVRSSATRQSSALEAAIDSMSANDGICLDQQHYHSFKGVSVLMPMRTCHICSQRLQLSVAFSNIPTVQCAACGIYVHRKCAFGRTRELGVCPINFKKAQEQRAKELMSADDDDNQNTKADDDVPDLQIDQESDNTDDQASLTSNTKPTGSWSFSLPSFTIQKPPSSANDGESCTPQSTITIGQRIGPSDYSVSPPSSPRTASRMSDEQKSIFRSPRKTPVTIGTPTDHNQTIRLCYSEDGILHYKPQSIRTSKANFPFLSASSLLPSQRKQHYLYGSINRGNDSSSLDDRLLRRNQTWDGTNTVVLQNATKLDFDALIDLGTEPKQIQPLELTLQSTMEVPSDSEPISKTLDANDEDSRMAAEWTADGPPAHWANSQILQGLPSRAATTNQCQNTTNSEDLDKPVHFASHPFASVSEALHQHILFHFRRGQMPNSKTEDRANNRSISGATDSAPNPKEAKDEIARQQKTEVAEGAETTPTKEMAELLKESNPQIDRQTNNIRLGLATVAGGIAGGMAGLVVAGPVGGAIGAKLGQTAGILGLALEGSVAVGVITSGIAAGSHAGQQLQDKLDEDRVLTLGGDGIHRNVMLVRPRVKTDPAWEGIYAQARKSFPKNQPFNILRSDSKAVQRERYEREFDIVKTDEDEIPTEDKVLLLVSRILNNKESLPGHVYRELLDKAQSRAEARGLLQELPRKFSSERQSEKEDDEFGDSFTLIRARRQDAHAAIKYVTATLLEVRPGFAASPSITELTATAVEGLVFGGLYDMVFEEIEAEYEHQDNALLEKISAFETSQGGSPGHGILKYSNLISQDAVSALHCLPEAHSAVDKLRYCVQFLEKISEFFSISEDCKEVMGADSLLKMVCQHIIVAKIFSINAQIAFLDEFARDEQLLRGREGYALVTIQASLHFLNACEDIESDIFGQEDEHD